MNHIKRSLFTLILTNTLIINLADFHLKDDISNPNEEPIIKCYDDHNLPQQCVPIFTNVAFGKRVEATNTCGDRQPTQFCTYKKLSASYIFSSGSCDYCDARVPGKHHSSSYLTDFHYPDRPTWWQSETLADGVHKRTGLKNVNFTLRLGKTHEITYVHLKFVNPQPESFVIYKKTRENEEWIPWQYYSASCRTTFNMPQKAPILPGNEAVAQCTGDFSDISPLTGGVITFATLHGRPSAKTTEESETLREWITATEIRVSFIRFNTFGDERYQDKRSQRFYWYGVSDFAVGGQCKCNGHGNKCIKSTGLRGDVKEVCECQHNTIGVDCEQCAPFYVDRPWRPATSMEANECLVCNCNNMAKRCFFDDKLFEETGHGGHCIDCAGNTGGPHCQYCLPGFWRRPDERFCAPCSCHKVGAYSDQCDENGQCSCKPGVEGKQCDRCANGYFDLSSAGCKDCGCNIAGSYGNTPSCSSMSGDCNCKMNVEGKRCDRCKPGYFKPTTNESDMLIYGCIPCFCFGHASICSPANELSAEQNKYFATNISSYFPDGSDGWVARSDYLVEELNWSSSKTLEVSQTSSFPVYFHAPAKFLGDQRFLYNQDIQFWLRVFPGKSVAWSSKDLVLTGANGRTLSLPLIGQKNPKPSCKFAPYKFRINNDPVSGWNPRLREIEFIGILSNLTSIRIRGTYAQWDVASLANFSIGTASKIGKADVPTPVFANWVESCKCPLGFTGQFCERCESGYRRLQPFGGSFSRCVKCECNGHSNECDAESGQCLCEHHTDGKNCERCARGWYGNSLDGSQDGCKKCECPDNGPCVQLNEDGDMICTDCPEGYAGKKCEYCSDDYFGDPSEGIFCKHCECSGNIDENAIGRCDPMSGKCLKCIHHTTGFNCEHCSPGFWGDALAEVKGDCKFCSCYSPGTVRPSSDYDALECRQSDGQCNCQPNVIGKQCEMCQEGFFNLTSGNGCVRCNCDQLGSLGVDCDEKSGQCRCKSGVMGTKCDQCANRHYGFEKAGCKECICDSHGAEDSECDLKTGQCLCKDLVEGRQCNRCAENYYGLHTLGYCEPCDDCYRLIQLRRNNINVTMSEITQQLDDLEDAPVNDSEFESELSQIRLHVNDLHAKAKNLGYANDTPTQEFRTIRDQVTAAEIYRREINKAFDNISTSTAAIKKKLAELVSTKDTINTEIDEIQNYFQTKHEDFKRIEKAIWTSDRSASKKLTKLAQTSQKLANSQKDKAVGMESLVWEVGNLTSIALKETMEVINKVSEASDEPQILQQLVESLRSLLGETLENAHDASIRSEEVLSQGASVLSGIEDIRIPEVDFKKISERLKLTKSEISRIFEMNNTAAKNRRLAQSVADMLESSSNAFINAKQKSSEIEASMAELTGLRNQAQKAVEKSQALISEMKTTSEILEFKNDSYRQEFIAASENFPYIKIALRKTNLRIARTRKLVDRLERRKNRINRLTSKAWNKTAEFSMKTDEILGAANKFQEKANISEEQISNLEEQIQMMENDVADRLKEIGEERSDVDKELRRSVAAASLASSLNDSLDSALNKMNENFAQLGSTETVSDDELDEMEKYLNIMEKEYNESKIKQSIHEEKIRHALTEKSNLRSQISELEMELKSFRNIRDTLPIKCFNVVKIEQEN